MASDRLLRSLGANNTNGTWKTGIVCAVAANQMAIGATTYTITDSRINANSIVDAWPVSDPGAAITLVLTALVPATDAQATGPNGPKAGTPGTATFKVYGTSTALCNIAYQIGETEKR